MGRSDNVSNYMSDASGTFAHYVGTKIAASESDYYGYHNPNAMGKMEVALDLVSLIRALEDEAIASAFATPSLAITVGGVITSFLEREELYEDAVRLYDELCSWRRTRFT